MPNRAYRKGARFENRVFWKLFHAGYYVARSARSLGAFDLIAVKNGLIIGVQCKKRPYLSKYERDRMLTAYKCYGIIPILATKRNNRIVFVDIRNNRVFDVFNGQTD